jgi:hypothetical protein
MLKQSAEGEGANACIKALKESAEKGKEQTTEAKN